MSKKIDLIIELDENNKRAKTAYEALRDFYYNATATNLQPEDIEAFERVIDTLEKLETAYFLEASRIYKPQITITKPRKEKAELTF